MRQTYPCYSGFGPCVRSSSRLVSMISTKMKPYLLSLLLILLIGCNRSEKNDTSKEVPESQTVTPDTNQIALDARLEDWAKGAVKVKAVVFDCAEGKGEDLLGYSSDRRLVENGVEHPFIVQSASRFLTTEEVAELANLVTGEHGTSGAAGCYIPHHGFIFYASDGSIVAHLEVCLMCKGNRSFPYEGLANPLDYQGLNNLFNAIGLPVYDDFDDWTRYFAKNKK